MSTGNPIPPEPTGVGIEHVAVADPERTLASLARLVSHVGAVAPDDDDTIDVFMIACRTRHADALRDELAEAVSAHFGDALETEFRGEEFRARGETVSAVDGRRIEGEQRTDQPKGMALYGSLYLDRGERWDKAREQIDVLKQKVATEDIAPAGFFFDVLYAARQHELAQEFVERIQREVREAFADFPGLEVSVSAVLAKNRNDDPRHGGRRRDKR